MGDDLSTEFIDAMHKLLVDLVSFWLIVPGIGAHIHRWMLRNTFNVILRHINKVIKKRRSNPEMQINDLLGLMMSEVNDDGEVLSDGEIRDMVLAFFLAGYETTSSTITWMLYLLSKDPQRLQKTRLELDNLSTCPPSFDELKNLEYLKQVFLETLRLYPPVVYVQRGVYEETLLAGTDIKIPAGVTVQLSIYAMQRDKKAWGNDADLWIPERWNEQKQNPAFFGAFTAGPRECLGTPPLSYRC